MWLLAAVLIVRDRRRRVVARSGPRVDAIPVEVAFDEASHLAVLPVDGGKPFAFVPVDYDSPELDELLAAEDDEEDESDPGYDAQDRYLSRYTGPAYLAGELVAGAWPVIVTPSGTLWPTGPLRARRPGESLTVLPPLAAMPVAREASPTTVAVEPVPVPDLPWTVRFRSDFAGWGVLLLLVAMLMTGPGLVAILTGDGEEGAAWWELLLRVAAATWMINEVLVLVCGRIVVDRDTLTVRRITRERTVRWADVTSVRRDGDDVVIGMGKAGGQQTLRFGGGKQRPSARQVAGVLERIRAEPRPGGPEPSTRLSWGVFPLAIYVVVVAIVLARWLELI